MIFLRFCGVCATSSVMYPKRSLAFRYSRATSKAPYKFFAQYYHIIKRADSYDRLLSGRGVTWHLKNLQVVASDSNEQCQRIAKGWDVIAYVEAAPFGRQFFWTCISYNKTRRFLWPTLEWPGHEPETENCQGSVLAIYCTVVEHGFNM